MIVTFSSPRKGLGQTTTLINIAMFIEDITKESILIMDLNKQNHIKKYLKGDKHIKTLDDYIMLCKSNKTADNLIKNCVTGVAKRIDIIGANDCFVLDTDNILLFLEQAKSLYEYIFIDTDNSDNFITEILLREGDFNIVLLQQSIDMVNSIVPGTGNMHKTIYLVNKYLESLDGIRVLYTKYKIEGDLMKCIPCTLDKLNTSIDKEYVYKLPLDSELINFHNQNTIASYILTINNSYKKSLELIVKRILFESGEFIKYYPSNIRKNKGNKVLSFIAKIFNFKAGEEFAKYR